jgi:uncharacterized lipoprotein
MIRTAALAVFLAALLSGCGGRLACENPDRYAGSLSIPPVQVPEDPTPPDETQSLAIPPAPERDVSASPGQCLESPPSYFEERA